jgi:polyhydroxybutyrate depolymerase
MAKRPSCVLASMACAIAALVSDCSADSATKSSTLSTPAVREPCSGPTCQTSGPAPGGPGGLGAAGSGLSSTSAIPSMPRAAVAGVAAPAVSMPLAPMAAGVGTGAAMPMRGAAGRAGAATGGAGMAAVATPAPAMNPAVPTPAMSQGCGNAMPPASNRYKIQVADLMREYIVKLPANYDASKPYKLIFAWHYLGGNAQGIATGFGGGYYGLEAMANNTVIFVAPEGIDMAWPNTGGRDVNFAKAMVDWMRTNYCIDNKHIFSVGFSYGAIMSNTVGCQMGDVFRAIAPMSGSGPISFGANACKGPVAAWMSHGNMDTTVPFASGQASRDYWAKANGCQTTTKPTDPSPCVAYDGCMQGYPVTWCEFSGAHQQPPFGPAAIWKFFSQF